MTDLLRINIAGGKYTLIQEASGKTVMHRYDEHWLEDMPGTKAILSMGYELEELRDKAAKQAQLLSASKVWFDALVKGAEIDPDKTAYRVKKHVVTDKPEHGSELVAIKYLSEHLAELEAAVPGEAS